MQAETNTEIQFLGDTPPMLLSKHGKRPERRQVSKRWFASSVLVGVTSFFLMGGALYAALDGREKLLVPAQSIQRGANIDGIAKAPRGNHPGLRAKVVEEDSNILMVSTISRAEGRNIVKVKPFLKSKRSLSSAPAGSFEYPRFNPLSVFSESGSDVIIAKSSDFMYGADVEGGHENRDLAGSRVERENGTAPSRL